MGAYASGTVARGIASLDSKPVQAVADEAALGVGSRADGGDVAAVSEHVVGDDADVVGSGAPAERELALGDVAEAEICGLRGRRGVGCKRVGGRQRGRGRECGRGRDRI